MMRTLRSLAMALMCLVLPFSPPARAAGGEVSLASQRVVYDVKTASAADFENVLDRVSFLNTRLGADPFSTSIVAVLHGDEIEYFVRDNELEYHDILSRARSLTMGETIEFRVCQVSARKRGYAPEDLQSFVKVVPMSDAEIVQLQFDGYVYMR